MKLLIHFTDHHKHCCEDSAWSKGYPLTSWCALKQSWGIPDRQKLIQKCNTQFSSFYCVPIGQLEGPQVEEYIQQRMALALSAYENTVEFSDFKSIHYVLTAT